MFRFPRFLIFLALIALLAGSVAARQTVLYHSQAEDGSEFLVRVHLHEGDEPASIEVVQAPRLPGAGPALDLFFSGAESLQADSLLITAEDGSLEVAVTGNGTPDPLGTGTLQLAAGPELPLQGIGAAFSGELASPDGRFTVSAEFPVFLSEPWAGQHLFGDANMGLNLEEGLGFFSQSAGEQWNWFQLDETAFVTALSSRVLSGMKIQFSFTGGAHPNTARETRTLLGNAYGSWYEATYLCAAALHLGWACDDAFVREQVITQLQRDGAGAVSSGEVTAATPWLLDKFVLTPNTVMILFDPYEVGAYAEGAFLVEVPYGQLSR